MKKVLSLVLIWLLVLSAACAPRPVQTDFAELPLMTEAPVDTTLTLLPSDQGPSEAPAGTPEPTETSAATAAPTAAPTAVPTPKDTESPVKYGEDYDTKDEVALYLHLFGELPPHFVTKKEAQDLGWSGGEVEKFIPGAAIGGDYFGNYEGLLPKKKGRKYYECDIGTVGRSSRGAKRIIYSNDGLIYYTDDHYENFTLLYGEE